MTPDEKLTALWSEAAPAAHDAAFTIAVMERLERRQMRRELIDLVPWAIVVTVLAWALAPAVEQVFLGLDSAAQLAAAGTIVTAAILGGIWLALGASRAEAVL